MDFDHSIFAGSDMAEEKGADVEFASGEALLSFSRSLSPKNRASPPESIQIRLLPLLTLIADPVSIMLLKRIFAGCPINEAVAEGSVKLNI